MIRIALPKGRNLVTALAAFRSAGLRLDGLESGDRRLRITLPDEGIEVLFLKDWDVPLYVAYGVADCGVVGSDVLEETGTDLLVPARFSAGRSRLSMIGAPGTAPTAGSQVRLATKYPVTAQQWLTTRSWGAEVLPLTGSIELAPLLGLADLALDIVQTGQTLRDNGLVELERVREVAPCLVVGRASYQAHRATLNDLIHRLEAADVVEK